MLHDVTFTGSGREYFRIWIVNLALTMASLGLYSPWAKVRRLQYFYRHTRLAGASFDYHGQPMAILRGRIVALALFGLYSIVAYVQLVVAVLILALLAAVLPWLLNRSLRFRLHNSSYRGLRFRFLGATRTAYWVFLALPVLTVLTLFGASPFWHHRLKQYQHGNAAYGRSPFRYGASLYDFYRTYLGAAGLFVVVLIMVGVTLVVTIVAIGPSGPRPGPLPAWPPMIVGAVYLAGIVGIQSFVTARIQNTVWNRTRIDRHTFTCEIDPLRLFGIQFTNLLATLLTLSLFRPFGQVRLARYLTSVFTVEVSGGLDDVEAAESDVTTAAGDEAAEFFDIDIAL